MPKSKTRRKSGKKATSNHASSSNVQWGGTTDKLKPFTKAVLGLIAIGVVGGIGFFWWNAASTSREFDGLIAGGQGALADVVSTPNRGRRHLNIGEHYNYNEGFPTSGPHAPIWARPGFYTAQQLPVQLVHAIEHGNIVIYYDKPSPENLAMLKNWASLYQGQWDGVVVTPARSLGEGIVLTAWQKRLRLPKFDPASAAAFVDAFRGRGPENKVR